ncbi:UPF0158 family protein [Thioalkalivibrio sp. ALgr3]|uniref:UPF0158 family protein n=1 Tax=Thioalkalivibrio sp. ALgr3 TaxID=1239292 RepID=UPI00035FAAD7|nr:UPF0158 family protein [Thioalkalivibrio sp. ALgr3]
MPLPVVLKDVLEQVDPLTDGWQTYVHRTTGEVVGFSDEDEILAEEDPEELPEWQQEVLQTVRAVHASDDYVRLPDPFDFDEYGVMAQFCRLQEDPDLRSELLEAIRGRGAFRRFKDLIHDRGIDQDWYACRDEALKAFLADFFEAEGIPFVDE